MYGSAYFGSSYYGPAYFGGQGVDIGAGGAKGVGGERGLSAEEVAGLEAYGVAVTGVIEAPPEEILEKVEISIPKSTELEYIIESPESQVIPEIPVITEIQEKIEFEEDIGLILAIIEAHNN